MNFERAFSFVLDDPDWAKKVIIGGLMTLIPIVGQLLVLGYMIAVGRNVIRDKPQPLPAWDDWGQMIVDGVYAFVVYLVYAAPLLVVLCLFLLPALVVGGAFKGAGELGAIGVVGICCFVPFALIYGIAVQWFFLPAALGRYADSGDVMSALRLGEIWAITRADPIVFLMALLVTLVASLMASLGVILCIVGLLFTQFYAQCVMGHAYGQAYRVATGETA